MELTMWWVKFKSKYPKINLFPWDTSRKWLINHWHMFALWTWVMMQRTSVSLVDKEVILLETFLLCFTTGFSSWWSPAPSSPPLPFFAFLLAFALGAFWPGDAPSPGGSASRCFASPGCGKDPANPLSESSRCLGRNAGRSRNHTRRHTNYNVVDHKNRVCATYWKRAVLQHNKDM